MNETDSGRDDGFLPDLTVDRIIVPMKCLFVDCSDFWLREIRQRLATAENICFDEVPELPAPPGAGSLKAGATVVMEVASTGIEASIRQIHSLYQMRILVLVVGTSEIQAYSTHFHAAGASAVVTDIFGCDRLTSVIRKAAARQPEVLADWKTRFVNRMPWNAV